jgi:hypothetical protein
VLAFRLDVRVKPESSPLMHGWKQPPLPRVSLWGSVWIPQVLLFLVFVGSPLSASADDASFAGCRVASRNFVTGCLTKDVTRLPLLMRWRTRFASGCRPQR